MFETADDRHEGPFRATSSSVHPPFVGRQIEREQIKTSVKRGDKRLFKIVGGPVVGKSRLAEEVSRELYEESVETSTALKIIKLPLRDKSAEFFSVLRLKILQEFGQPDSSEELVDFSDELNAVVRCGPPIYYLIILDDCDQMDSEASRTKFIELVYTLVNSSKRVKVILTSRVEFKFPRVYTAAETFRLRGLPDRESLDLLQRAAPNVDFSTHAQPIIDRCCGLPLMLIIYARVLEERHMMFSPKELCEILNKFPCDGLSTDLISDNDNMEQIIGKFVDCLNSYLKSALALLSYFPGSFSSKGAAYVAKLPSESVVKALNLIPLYDRSIVEFHSSSRRFSVFPLLRQYVNANLCHLRDTDAARQRFSEFYSQILIKVAENYCRESGTLAVNDLYDEWPNVEQLMKEAGHPSADLFLVNMQVVLRAPEVINTLMPEQADEYYQRCRSAAEMFGTKFDIACINSCLATTVGFIKVPPCAKPGVIISKEEANDDSYHSRGNGLQEAVKLMKQVESTITTDTPCQFVKLMAQFEWNFFRQGKMEQARRFQDLGLSVVPDGPDRERIMRIQVNIRNHRALLHICEGNPAAAVQQLRENIQFTTAHFKNHPAIRVMLNSLGLAYSELGDQAKALMYFSASLAERRRCCGPAKRELVIPLSNVANLLCQAGQYDIAMKLISEAVEIRKQIEWLHLDTAIAVYHKGKILRMCGNFSEGLEWARKAFDIFEKCTPTHFHVAGARIDIAMCLKGQGHVPEAKDLLRSVIDGRHFLEQNLPLNKYILEAFDCLLEMLDHGSWMDVAKEKSAFLQSLIDAKCQQDGPSSGSFNEQLRALEEKMALMSETPRGDQSAKSTTEDTILEAKAEELLEKVSKLESNPNNMDHRETDFKVQSKKLPEVLGKRNTEDQDDCPEVEDCHLKATLNLKTGRRESTAADTSSNSPPPTSNDSHWYFELERNSKQGTGIISGHLCGETSNETMGKCYASDCLASLVEPVPFNDTDGTDKVSLSEHKSSSFDLELTNGDFLWSEEISADQENTNSSTLIGDSLSTAPHTQTEKW